MAGALDGLTIIDLSRFAPGFYVSQYFGDMGADVIKIDEPPPKGRRGGFTDRPLEYKDVKDVRGAALNTLERNKRRITLNLKDEAARGVFYRLVERADVVLEGNRPGVAKRLGVDYETCREINDRIIYCSLTGYGQDGPYEQRAGHDINYISTGGALGITGTANGAPAIPGNVIADYAGGSQFVIIGVLTALIARGTTGKGQFVDIAMTDGVFSLLTQFVQQYLNDGVTPQPGQTRLTGAEPHYSVYEAKDGRWIGIGANEPWFYANVCRLIGRGDLADCQHDLDRKEEIRQAFAEAFKTKTAQEWHDLLADEDTCVTKVLDFGEVLRDPQLAHRGMVLDLEHPEAGKVKQVGFPVKLSATPGGIRRFAGLKGADTDAILAELGYSPEETARLRDSGAAL